MREQVKNAKGFVFDMDGTLVLGDKASGNHKKLEGAAEVLEHLRANDIPYQVFTNGTARTPLWYANSLRSAGLNVRDEEMMTPSTAAAAYLKEKGAERILVLGKEPVWSPLKEAGLSIVESPGTGEKYDAIYVGWFREFTFPDLEAAVQAIWDGALLTTASDVPFFAAAGGRGLGTSFAINAMLKALTNTEALVLGKPSSEALKVAMSRMGLEGVRPEEIVVVGDDPDLESKMANDFGALSVSVATGLYSTEDFAGQPADKRPGLILENINELMEILGTE
ncbi:HAD-IIA family hydrolase [Emcibacter sp.]|uniref:HAD-IIA family hydrolase n=1 Tax=Emcibacter sp. TaxID=1979954 RepID=UPI002AA62B06|nr:HAD family hydrolase [Emcibacter sp.]